MTLLFLDPRLPSPGTRLTLADALTVVTMLVAFNRETDGASRFCRAVSQQVIFVYLF